MKNTVLLKRFCCEMLGTFIITLTAFLSVLLPSYKIILSIFLGIIFCFCYYLGFKISGSHFNPLVSLICRLSKKISWKEYFADIGGQLCGILASGCILIFSNQDRFRSALNSLTDENIIRTFPLAVLVIFILSGSFLFISGYCIASEKNVLKTYSGVFLGALMTLITMLEPTLMKTLSINPFFTAVAFVYMLSSGTSATGITVGLVFLILPFVSLILVYIGDLIYRKKHEGKDPNNGD